MSDWLGAKPEPWLAGITTAVIDPYAGYARGLAEGLPGARLVCAGCARRRRVSTAEG